MARRRTLLLITEGTSDANALVAPLQNLLDGLRVGDFQIRCDVTTARLYPQDFKGKHGFAPYPNIGRTVDGLVDEYVSQNLGSVTGLGWIAQLTDQDGAYIPDEAVHEAGGTAGRAYSDHGVTSPNRAATLAEMAEKRRCIDFLVDRKTQYRRSIKRTADWVVPYRLFYMSRNLEHGLYGMGDVRDPDEKDLLAAGFAMRNMEPDIFRETLEQAAARHGRMPDWESSWGYARESDTFHSLQSGGNLKWIEEFAAGNEARESKVADE